ncbi:CUB and sushi domain-containing protein 3, partial [Branchiostoma belcheri]
ESIMTGPSGGPVTSPNYPSNYDNNEIVRWLIIVPEGSIIRLTFARFYTGGSDFLTIYDGTSDDATELRRLSGYHQEISPIFSTSNTMLLRFTPKGRYTSQGFQFSYISRTADECWDPGVPSNGTRDNNSNFTSGQTVREGVASTQVTRTSIARLRKVKECGLHVTSGLESIMTGPSGGPVRSPDYYSNYDNSVNARWLIIVPEGSIIRLTFVFVDIFVDSGFLTIYDGNGDDATELRRFSGYHRQISPIISTSNTMLLRFTPYTWFWFSYISRTPDECWDPGVPSNGTRDNNNNFTSGQTVRYTCMDGYHLWGTANITCQANGTWSDATTTCEVGSIMTGPFRGPVTSPDFPRNYDNNENVRWLITVPEGSIIRLTFDSFDTQYDDILTIYDGASHNATVIRSPIISTSNTMFLRFTSNYYYTRQGFQFYYTSRTADECWDPGVPANGARDNNSNFTLGQTVRYTCMSGYHQWGTANITCQSNWIWSDATPTCEVGSIMTGHSGGPVTSPNFPSFYGNNENVRWLIIVPEGSIIRLTFDSFATRYYDILTIYDGASDNTTELRSLSGYHRQISPIISTSNTMFLRFTSDYYYTLQGFQFSYISRTADQCWDPGVPTNGKRDNNSNFTLGQTVRYTCMAGYYLNGTADITCQSNGTWSDATPTCEVTGATGSPVNNSVTGRGTNMTGPSGGPVTSPNFPSNYGNNENYQWLITVPEASIIRLTLDSFDTEEGFDFFTIYDGTSDNAAELQRLTGVPWPISPITSTSNTMFLRFTSDYSVTRQGFNFSYISSTAGQCWDPGVPANGISDNNSNFTSGQTVRYTCMAGYHLWGTGNITCQSNGTWSDATPNCKVPLCFRTWKSSQAKRAHSG